MKKQPKFGMIIIYLLILGASLMLFSYFSQQQKPDEVQYSEVVTLFESEQVESFSIKDNKVTMKLNAPYKDQKKVWAEIVDFSVFYADMDDLVREQYAEGILKEYNYPPNSEPSWFVTLLPYLLIGGLRR